MGSSDCLCGIFCSGGKKNHAILEQQVYELQMYLREIFYGLVYLMIQLRGLVLIQRSTSHKDFSDTINV